MTTAAAPAPSATAARPGSVPAAPRPAAVPRLRLLRHEPDPEQPDHPRSAGSRRASGALRSRAVVPDDLYATAELRRRAHHVVGLVLEVLGGRRPLPHLVPHLEPPALRYVRAALGPPVTRQPSRMTSLHVNRPCAGAVEVVAVYRAGARARALAARIEGRPEEPDGWRCTAIRLL
jgi:Family of unknown function (DUF6459)